MNELLVSVSLAVLGLFFGSFAGATVWRLRARQLVEDKAAGEEIDKNEFKRLKSVIAPVAHDRSRCLHCHHQLAWYDLVPLMSWVSLGGRCRYCRTSIGWFEPLVELGTALFFVLSYLAWPEALQSPVEILQFGIWLAVGVGLIILLCYDARWFLLPDKIVFPLMGVAFVYACVIILGNDKPLEAFLSVIVSCGILSGLYFALYLVSKGAWVGFGDIKLGLVLALMLSDWQLALLALFLANIIGCIVVLPGLVFKRLSRTSHVPFGPMLIGGFWIAGLYGRDIIDWYMRVSFPFL
jgi:prepilin signal peptidase PulO-like enzyme (type II secretory pathway)